ncbi:hypothetical protein [Kitasatospora sp. NPDC089509]|uniref:hypothetical protein n=1 Tax=Kitasatospora sp. NPDC089509 TaxID=3364079 RepID=UPI0038096766
MLNVKGDTHRSAAAFGTHESAYSDNARYLNKVGAGGTRMNVALPELDGHGSLSLATSTSSAT